MRFIFLFIFLFTCSFAEDFITPYEYGKMLYQNPRGIGCDKCHGIKGEGKIIATYKSRGKNKKLVAPPIYNLKERVFLNSLTKKSKVMPKYFLTKDEMKSLYYYIQESSKLKN